MFELRLSNPSPVEEKLPRHLVSMQVIKWRRRDLEVSSVTFSPNVVLSSSVGLRPAAGTDVHRGMHLPHCRNPCARASRVPVCGASHAPVCSASHVPVPQTRNNVCTKCVRCGNQKSKEDQFKTYHTRNIDTDYFETATYPQKCSILLWYWC